MISFLVKKIHGSVFQTSTNSLKRNVRKLLVGQLRLGPFMVLSAVKRMPLALSGSLCYAKRKTNYVLKYIEMKFIRLLTEKRLRMKEM